MNKRKASRAEAAAIEDLLKRIRIARGKGDYKELANLHNQLGNQHRLLGNYEEALEHHEEEANISKAYVKKDRMGLGIAYRNIGEVLTEMRNEMKAIQYIRMYLKISKEVENFAEEQRAYITLGRAYLAVADKDGSDSEVNAEKELETGTALEKAERSFRAAYQLLNDDRLKDQLKDEKELMLMKCNNCQNLGLTLEMRGKSDAPVWLKRAIEIGVKYMLHENLASCYSVLCGIYLKNEKPKDALEAARNATKAAKALGNQILEVESQLLEAKALFLMDEVEAAKKILKRLRQRMKKKDTLHCYLEELEPLLTAAVRICRTQDIIFVTDDGEKEKLLKLYETLADNYTTVMNYEAAISNYRKCCKLGEDVGISTKKLSRLCFSIAESYRDLKKYDSALSYYLKELEMHRGNTVEEFKTQTNISLVLEKLNKAPDEVMEAHERAIALAKATKHWGKQITALNNYGLYLKSTGKFDEAERQISMANQIKDEINVSDSEETETDSQDLLDDESDIDLDNLSEEDDSDDEADDENRGRRKRVHTRTNEAGETQLHLAAKKGDLKAVRRLIRQGHPVKVRDNAGWTPLHEACNFGHATIVEELLKHGAEVNDSGGALAEKITPLHDAACNCHSEVIKVLLKYGANPIARDAEGRYPIDSLISWRQSEAGRDCSEQDLIPYRVVKHLLKEEMAKAGKEYRMEDEKRARKKTSARSSSPKMSLLVSKARDLDCPIPVKIATDDYDPDQEGEGKKLYASAMKGVRRKDLDATTSAKEKPRPISPGPRGALIPAELDVHDDWLLPDNVIKNADTIVDLEEKTSNTKRKRDSLDDSIGHERITKRKTGNSRRSLDKNERVSKSSKAVINNLQYEEEEFELMDICISPNRSQRENVSLTSTRDRNASPTTSRNSPDDPMLLNDDEDFSDLFENDMFAFEASSDGFLPSQRPVGPVEFGKTCDVEIVDDNHGEDNSDSPVMSRRKRQSPRKKPRAVDLFSDDDEDTPTSSKVARNNLKFSQIASALKEVSDYTALSKRNQNGGATVQSRLPFKVINKPKSSRLARHSRSSSPEEITNSFRRTSSSASLAIVQNNENKAKKEVLRLKIRILENVLLVPVDERHINETIDWLSNECATRYMRSYGVKPILSLQTKDGANLSGADSISLVLEANERELVGVVTGFDLPPLVERYCSACAELSIEPDPLVKSNLNICQSSNLLHLTDINLRGKPGSLVMSSLQRQYALRVLVLSGCSLFDAGLAELCRVLPTLPGVTEIDISCNGITKNGFLTLADTFNRPVVQDTVCLSSNVPIGLTSLILSHNPLGNFVGNILATLINRLSCLKRLHLCDCDFTDKLFTWSKSELTKALSNSRLEEVDISQNSLNDAGVEKFLQSLPARKLRSLNCSSCISNHKPNSGDTTAKAFSSFLSQNEDCCNLKTLQINDCCLNDKTMELILDNFDRLVRLETLEVRCNDRLTAVSLVKILQRSVERNIPLTQLDIGNIPALWNTSRATQETILHALEVKMSSEKKLCLLKLPSTILTEDDDQPQLSKLESSIVNLMEDYAGSLNFRYEKQGACIVYFLED